MSLFLNGVETNTVMLNGVDTTGYFNGNMVWGSEPIYKTRYEYTLFDTNNGTSTSAGNYSDSFANYNEIGLLVGYGNKKDNGRQWIWFDSNIVTGNTGNKYLNYAYCNAENTTFHMEVVRFNFNNTAKSFTIDYPNTSLGWQFYSTKTDNTTLKANYDVAKKNCIEKIVGVKYQ